MNQQTLSGFLAAFFPDEYEPIHLRAFAPKKAPGDEPRFAARQVIASRHAPGTMSTTRRLVAYLLPVAVVTATGRATAMRVSP